jgi:thiamine pyrophosphokinase
VDGGYAIAEAAGLVPDLVIGDFDSLRGDVAPGVDTERLPAEKDDTDTMLALKRGFDMGFRDFLIVGGLGGRFDHSLANIQALSYCLDMKGRAVIADGGNIAMMTDDAALRLERREGFYFSLFSWSESCEGLCVDGAKYPLDGYRLTRDDPLGVSNEFLAGPALIRKKAGRLLIVLSRDRAAADRGCYYSHATPFLPISEPGCDYCLPHVASSTLREPKSPPEPDLDKTDAACE